MTQKPSSEKEFSCPHGRASYKGCPHCLGINKIKEYLDCGLSRSTCEIKDGDEYVNNCQKVEGKKHVFESENTSSQKKNIKGKWKTDGTGIHTEEYMEGYQRTGDLGRVASSGNKCVKNSMDCQCPRCLPASSESKKCESSDTVYTSNPPQLRCKNCGQLWFSEKETPICKMVQMNTIFPLKEYPPEMEWEKIITDVMYDYGNTCIKAHGENEESRFQEGKEIDKIISIISKAISEARADERRKVVEEVRKEIIRMPLYDGCDIIASHACDLLKTNILSSYSLSLTKEK